MNNIKLKTEIFNHLPKNSKELIIKAANLSGQSINDFILNAILIYAQETIDHIEVIKLSKNDQTQLANDLTNLKEPSKELKSNMEWYRKDNEYKE